VILVWLIWTHGWRSARAAVAFLVCAIAICGWWFVRNIYLYGDPTASSGVHRMGLSFPRYVVHGVSGVGHVMEEFVTYLWVPTEYLRNEIHAASMLKAILLVTTVAVAIVGGTRLGRARTRPGSFLVIGCAVLSWVTWLVTYLGFQAVAPRVAYLALPLWVVLVALALTRLRPRAAIVATAVAIAVLNAWALAEVLTVHTPTFLIFSSS
jgi:D-alanyl-D-alanine carboxypeptidase (penicillin-binding protein 5/6)